MSYFVVPDVKIGEFLLEEMRGSQIVQLMIAQRHRTTTKGGPSLEGEIAINAESPWFENDEPALE